MNVINLVLASGSGSRLYPLSTEEKPKQFLKLISEKMMVEETVNRFKPFIDDTYIVTLKKYKKFVNNLENLSIIYENERKESATSVYRALQEIKKEYSLYDTIIVQTPSDHYVREDYHFKNAIYNALSYANKGYFSMIGTEPIDVYSELGYIRDKSKMFEKPEPNLARELMEKGYKWNTAIYAYSLEDMLFYYEKYFDGGEISFEKSILPNIEDKTKVIDSNFFWKDIGTSLSFKEFEIEMWKG